ncbi:Pentapeptide repeat [Richelia intracellularis HH01]|jgi:uncharacterized protein YjbI with pentapeptide repeats|uniref:Pentapeptide repeat n=1 Tax=Richelia intracellularis HH01 TaxID=1165094 RepID=M1X2Y3_9NOST|nr:pentapeptide repeat-containing protein [Richelia intracellularis]CCH67625.1 Pentapeptide repeat [Richelia intracellularis HH01]HAE05472.1 pentapeptide repeat-containing protein [Richelia sp.]
MIKYLRLLIASVLALLILFSPISTQANNKPAVVTKTVSNKDFSGKSLIAAEFKKLNLENSNFSNADLRGAVFNSSLLSKANFHGVDFTNGIAYLVDFQGADLTDAILTEAMMLYSKFDDVDITGADFSNTVIDGVQLKKLCVHASGINSQTGVSTRESLECDY